MTLQEYLTAKYVDDHHQIEKLVTEHLTDKRWKEVFLLVSGLMQNGADELLLLMENVAQKYINTPKLQALLKWAEQATAGSSGNFKPVGKRAVAIANVIPIADTIANFIANVIPIADAIPDAIANVIAKPNAISDANFIAYAYANVIANLYADANTITNADVIANARELEKLKIFNNVNFTMLIDRLEALIAQAPDDQQPLEVRQAFVERLQKTLLNAFSLTPEIVELSKAEIHALGNYLYANYLMIQCKEAAVRVSPKTWEAIEQRMLLVSSN